MCLRVFRNRVEVRQRNGGKVFQLSGRRIERSELGAQSLRFDIQCSAFTTKPLSLTGQIAERAETLSHLLDVS